MHKTVSALPSEHWIRASEATAHLQRYPDLSPGEIDRLVIIYPNLLMLHVALMTSDDELGPRLEAFQRDHGKRLRTPLRQLVPLLIPLAIMVLVLLWTVLN
jgi:hypothetical protein